MRLYSPRSRHHNVVLSRHQQAPVVTEAVRGNIMVDALHVDGSIGDPCVRLSVLDDPLHPDVYLHC